MREIDPKDTLRAEAFELRKDVPMPMVTITHTLNVAHLVHCYKRKKHKLNMLLCWCIGKAALLIPEFFMLPVANKFLRYDKLAVCVVIQIDMNKIRFCNIPFSENLYEFAKNYDELTKKVYMSSEHFQPSNDYAVIGTSALVRYEIDAAINMYNHNFYNPYLIWGKIRHSWFKYTLPISFQFHHVQMDGLCAMRFLKLLQTEIDNIDKNFV